jgi:hypothetical protein
MKYTVKVDKILKEEIEVEVVANSYEEAFTKTVKSLEKKSKDFFYEVTHINGTYISNRYEASWQDMPVKNILAGFDLGSSEDVIREIFSKNKGVKSFEIHFSGSGDDGSIERVDVVPYSFDSVKEEYIGHETIETILTDIFEGLIIDGGVPIDWVNGDGGSGFLIISLDDQERVKVRMIASENAQTEGAYFERDLI